MVWMSAHGRLTLVFSGRCHFLNGGNVSVTADGMVVWFPTIALECLSQIK